jgi:anti-sigma B factor antagonist
MAELEITVDERGGRVHLALNGELDLASVPDFERAIEEATSASTEVLVLDLRALAFLDSSGLFAVIKANQRASFAGLRLVLIRGSKVVDDLLKRTRLEERFEIVDDPESI